MKIHKLKDDNGILAQTKEILPVVYYEDLLKTLAELEDNECYVKRKWPHCQLHKIDAGKKSRIQFTNVILTKFLDGDFRFNMLMVVTFLYVILRQEQNTMK